MSSTSGLRLSVSVLCLALCLAAAPALADEEVLSPEHGKVNTPDASPVDAGHYEVEATYTYGAASRAWSSQGNSQKKGFSSEHGAALSFTAGIIDNVDVAASFGYSWLRDKDNDFDGNGTPGPVFGRGFNDVDLQARWRFLRDDDLDLDVAYIGGVTIPAGRDTSAKSLGTTADYWSLNQTLVASKNWGRWTANADIGYALPIGSNRGNDRGTFNADVAGGYQLLSWLQPSAELNYAHNIRSHENNAETVAATFGLIMPVLDDVRIDTGVQQGLWGRNEERATTFSFAVKVAF